MDISRVRYTVVKNKGIVKCTVDNCRNDAIDNFNRKFLSTATSDLWVLAYESEKFVMPNKFTAVARCHPEDEFDEEAGKRIAFAKLNKKYHRSVDRHLANIMTALDNTLKTMDKYFEKRTF